MVIKPIFAWYDLWVGVFVKRSKPTRTEPARTEKVYIFPVPCFGVEVDLTRSSWIVSLEHPDNPRTFGIFPQVVQGWREGEGGGGCSPWAGGDYNGHCGGCESCLKLQNAHYGGTTERRWKPFESGFLGDAYFWFRYRKLRQFVGKFYKISP